MTGTSRQAYWVCVVKGHFRRCAPNGGTNSTPDVIARTITTLWGKVLRSMATFISWDGSIWRVANIRYHSTPSLTLAMWSVIMIISLCFYKTTIHSTQRPLISGLFQLSILWHRPTPFTVRFGRVNMLFVFLLGGIIVSVAITIYNYVRKQMTKEDRNVSAARPYLVVNIKVVVSQTWQYHNSVFFRFSHALFQDLRYFLPTLIREVEALFRKQPLPANPSPDPVGQA